MFSRLKPFIPIFILYAVVIVLFGDHEPSGDEKRHMQYAVNITQGYYADPATGEVVNGPGYPLVLAAMVSLGAPGWLMVSLNFLFLVGAIGYMFSALTIYTTSRQAILGVYLFGLYPTLFKWLPLLYSESLSLFLLAGFIYYVLTYAREQKLYSRKLLYAGMFLGFLTLTKYAFIHLLLALLVILLMLYWLSRKNEFRLFSAAIVLGCLVYSPFVVYNLASSGKFMLTGTSGAEMLYWRSSPHPDEAGNWVSFNVVLGKEKLKNLDDRAITKLQTTHLAFIQEVQGLTIAEKNRRITQKVIENIKSHPVSYARNTINSFLRLFFNIPRSYHVERLSSFVYVIPGAFLFVFTSLGFFIALFRYKELPPELAPLFLLTLLYIGELSLLNGAARYMLIITPLVFLFNTYVWNRLVRIRLQAVSEIRAGLQASDHAK